MTPGRPPLVGVSACIKRPRGESLDVHGAPEPYLRALTRGCGAVPLVLPALGAEVPPEELLAPLDGLLLTGSRSNVAPARYGAEPLPDGGPFDPGRDATTLALIPAALAAGLPVFAICRGFQELNVALGGSLHQDLDTLAAGTTHRDAAAATPAERFAPAHAVAFTPGGRLAAITGREEARVNSVHRQGIDRLGARLVVEATAPDGLVEAATLPRARGFVLGVQWHPEWDLDDPVSAALFSAFGEAIRGR